MQRKKAYALLLTFWYCLPPLVDIEDGTLPLPKDEANIMNEENEVTLWDFFCL